MQLFSMMLNYAPLCSIQINFAALAENLKQQKLATKQAWM